MTTPAPFKDHFSGHADGYARYRPGYPDALFDWLATQAPGRDLAWDVATGNGQAARALAGRFAAVVATDASAEQVARAEPHPRVTFRVEPAEATSLHDHSVDLVTVAQALHWFDADRFHAEVRRVARPGSLVAAWCYALAHVTPEVDAVVTELYDGIVGPYWPPERRLLERGYVDIAWPWPEVPAPAFAMTAQWTLAQLLGYLGTWSAVQRYVRNRQADPLAQVRPALTRAWGDPDQPRLVQWPLALRTGRVG